MIDKDDCEKIVDLQQTLIEALAGVTQKNGITPRSAILGLLLVATSICHSADIPHAEMVRLLRSLEEMRGKGVSFPWEGPRVKAQG